MFSQSGKIGSSNWLFFSEVEKKRLANKFKLD
jgi:hypothetical protein